MNEAELQVTLLALLPVIKLEDKPMKPDQCKYMIGTISGLLLIKSDKIMIRVGGGYATLEEHLRQVGPFECIKIHKLMSGDERTGTPPCTFMDAVVYYLKRLKTADRIVK